jgi:hypothetical protein
VLANSYAGAVVHALGAHAVVVLIVALVKRSDPDWDAPRARVPAAAARALRLWSAVAVALLFLNVFAAASLRQKIGAFAGHLTLALTAAGVLAWVARLAARRCAASARARRLARFLHALVGTQILLGVCAWAWLLGPLAGAEPADRGHFLLQAALATAHMLFGVLVMAAAAALAIEARWRIAAQEPA